MELETTESGWACNERGVAYAVNQQYDRAIADFDQAIRLTPHYSHFYNNRGIAFTEKGQYDRAIQDFDQAIRLTPNFAVPFQNRGRAFRMKGQKAQADADFTKAGQLNPNVPPPLSMFLNLRLRAWLSQLSLHRLATQTLKLDR